MLDKIGEWNYQWVGNSLILTRVNYAKRIIQSLKLDNDDSSITDAYGGYYTLYKGDFSNEGATEYALLSPMPQENIMM